MPGLAARSARSARSGAVEQHQLGQQGPQLPRELHLAGHRLAGPERRAARDPPRLPGEDDDPGLPRGARRHTPTPCFAGPHGQVSANGIKTTLYTVNQDADEWHLLLLWRHHGGLYTLSEHLAPPLDYRKVVVYLKQELGSSCSSHPHARREPDPPASAGRRRGRDIGAAGVYELVDQLASSPPKRAPPVAPELPEQHLLQGIKVVQQTTSRCSFRRSITRC